MEASSIKYKKHAAKLNACAIAELIKNKATAVYMEEQGTACPRGKEKKTRFVVLRVYGDWN